MVGGKRIQTLFPGLGCHTGLASEEAAVTREKSHGVGSSSLGRLPEPVPRDGLATCSSPSCPLAYFQMFQEAACGVLSGSVSLGLLSCSFSFLCFSPIGHCSFIDKKMASFSVPLKLPNHSPLLRRSLEMLWPASHQGRAQTAGHLIRHFFTSNNATCF